jgi:hypothetical protein
LYPPLQGQYRDFFGFFVNKLGIPMEVPTAKMVAALPRLTEIESAEERAKEALSIYKRAGRDLVPKPNQSGAGERPWLDSFRYGDVFLDQRGQLVANNEALFVNDWPEMGALFADVDDIALLAVPGEEIPKLRRLLDVVEVKYLSSSLVVDVVDDERGILQGLLVSKVRAVLGCIARLLYHRSNEKFEAARNEGLFAQLRDLEVVEVPNLQLRVTLGNVTKQTAGDIARSGRRVLVRRGARSLVDQLAIEICKLLRAPEDMSRRG